MIRGWLAGPAAHRRAYVTARVSVPSQSAAGNVPFLLDTGADVTVLAPRYVEAFELDLSLLAPGQSLVGIGGSVNTLLLDGLLTLGALSFRLRLQVLTPGALADPAAQKLFPCLLGRDILARLALFLEERTQRVLLLEPDEASRLAL